MRRLVLANALSLVMMVGCGKSRAEVVDKPREEAPDHPPAPRGPGKPRGALQTESDALRAFDAAFEEEVQPVLLSWSPKYASYHPGSFVRVSRMTCRDAAQGQQPHADERTRFFGDAKAIARDGDCWVLYEDNWGAPHPHAVLDAQSGALLYESFASCG